MKQDYITDDCYINGPEGTTFPGKLNMRRGHTI